MDVFFKDIEYQKQFDKYGFVKIKMFTEDEVNIFKEFYKSLSIHDEIKYGFSVSIDQMNDEVRMRLNTFFKSQVFPRFEQFLNHPKYFTGSFMIKEPYPTGTVAAHQDWTFVEEEKFQSLMCWISLDKTDITNGAMAFLKGSHRFFDQVRGFPCPLVPEPVEEYRYKLMPYLNVIDTEPGEVLIFDNKTIHGSFPNTSDKTRHGISITLTQASADFIAYYLNPTINDKYELIKYKVEDDFFDKYNNPKFHQFFKNKQQLEDLVEIERTALTPQKKDWNALQVLLNENENYFNNANEEKFGKLICEQEKWHLQELSKFRNNTKEPLLQRIKKKYFS